MSEIERIEVSIVRIEAKRAYRMAGMESGGGDYYGIVTDVATRDGVHGVSEIFITPGWYAPDTPDGTLGVIKRTFAPAVVGRSVFDLEAINVELDRRWMGNLFAKAAIEMAVHDAVAKTLGRPLCDLLGGRYRDRFEVVGGIGLETPEAMASQAVEFRDRGFQTIKLKIGAPGNPQLDVDRVRAVREAIGPKLKIRVDANGVFEAPDAVALIRKLEEFDLDHVEQPVPAHRIEAMAEIRQAIGVRLMADESVHSPDDALRVVTAKAADVVKIKIAKCGGFRRSRQIADLCAAAGLEVVVGQGIGTSLQALAELHLCCATAAISPAGEFIGPDKLAGDIADRPMVLERGVALLPDEPGLGAGLDRAALDKLKIALPGG
jgi:muconate cycloisomerase